MSRRGVERALLAVMAAGLLVHLGLHVAHALEATPSYAFIPITLALAAFTFAHATRVMGARAAVALFAVGMPLGWLAEQVGVTTGFPFGPYYYTDVFGPRLGEVPLIIPPAWAVIVYLGTMLANLAVERRASVSAGTGRLVVLAFVGAMVVTAFDLPADPFFVFEVKAWIMEREGAYFGEQARGFAGWVLVAFVIGVVFRLLARRLGGAPAQEPRGVVPLLPVVAYGGWGVFFAFFGYPEGTRVVAIFAMGIPVLLAALGWWDGQKRARSSSVA